jgi:hypothetical protein
MTRLSRPAALSLTASAPLLILGVAIHPHAPEAHTMPDVLYVQSGQSAWWPAHVFLLAGELLFAVFLVSLSRAPGLPVPLARALRVLLPVVWACVAAMVIHLLLPLGRDSVADSAHGWDFWVKDVAETMDAVYALCLAAVAWLLYRNRVADSRPLALVGVVGATWFGLFSLGIPLTGVVWTADDFHTLIPGVPAVGVLLTATWAIGTGLIALRHERSDNRGAQGVAPSRAQARR